MSMIAAISLLVRDYDEAIAFYCDTLGFSLLEDQPLGGGKRWVRVAPPGGQGACLLLAKAEGADQTARIGDQTGGRVGFFLHTENFTRDYDRMKKAGVQFCEQPRHEAYGSVAVFKDLYGNGWDLIQPIATQAE